MSGSRELRELLVALLEAERAGVAVAKKMLKESGSERETELLDTILHGEKDGCRALGKAIVHLGFTGSGNIGDFVSKIMALTEKTDRMNLLIRGQEWVVRKLDEVLKAELYPPMPPIDREALEQVRLDHVVNIQKCRQYLV